MNKKYLGMLCITSILGFSLLITGCTPKDGEDTNTTDSTETTVTSPNILPDNEVVSVMKNFSHELGANESDIYEDSISRYNVAENDFEEYSENPYYDINGYTISVNGLKDLPNMSKILDGWYVYYLGDEIGGAVIEYSKDNIICSYYNSLEQEIPYELMAREGDLSEEDEAAFDKARSDFYDIATYKVEISCGYLPEGAIQFKDFNFYAEGMEPFWRADIVGNQFNIFTPEGLEEEYIGTIQHQGDDFIIKGYSSNGKLEKSDCIDGGKGDTHEYKISFDVIKTSYGDDGKKHINSTTHYEGCADREYPTFVPGEEGTLKSFIKKSGYQYTKDYDQDKVYYSIGNIISKYMVVNFYYVDGDDYDSYQNILEKTDDNTWIVLYEGDGYEISDEECERLNQHDNDLMDMFFLKSCPRG